MTLKKSMGHYLLIFTLALIGLSVLVAIIGSVLSSSMTGMTAVVPMISAMLAGGRFLKMENRVPSDAERRKLTNLSFLVFLILNIIVIGLVASTGQLSGLMSGSMLKILGAVAAFIFLLTYFMIRWAYGGLTRKQAEKLGISDNSTFD